jgi:PPK2 family polyphosphate:nucleotide phosphotransferase
MLAGRVVSEARMVLATRRHRITKSLLTRRGAGARACATGWNREARMRDGVRVKPRSEVDLQDFPTDAKLGLRDKEKALAATVKLGQRLTELSGMLAANRKHSLLVVLQGMDASGKDRTVKHCVGPLNPVAVKVTSFKAPTPVELGHDFLWRVHAACPGRGEVGIFNRSHYEDVLIVRVESLVPEDVWSKRYDVINAFERNLVDEGTVIVKCWLNMSKDEQGVQMRERLEDPTKHWKFNVDDLEKRKKWDEYVEAYRVMLEKTSTEWAPWHVIPADHKWVRNLVVSELLVDALEGLDMSWPTLDPKVRKMKID